GMYLHFKTQETENDQELGGLTTNRKLYYRELISRYGHNLALNWNLGEENTNTTSQQIEFAQYFRDTDPYDNHIVIHSYPGEDDRVYTPLLGNASELTGASLQLERVDFLDVHGRVAEWVGKSANADGGARPWVVAVDEPGDADWALMPDGYSHSTQPNNQEEGRKNALWGTLMAGGAGNEWYFGYRAPESDLWLQDFRSRDRWWDYTRYSLEFFENNAIPFWEMTGDDNITSADYGFYKANDTYVVYDKAGGNASLNLNGASGEFQVRWFDPRNGGPLLTGSIATVNGGSTVDLGNAPNASNDDWVILVRQTSSTPIANAGVDQSVEDADNSGSELTTLDGTASSDPNGTIVSYLWTLSGSTIGTTATPQVDLPVGDHTIQLQVTDNDGETAIDTVLISVTPFVNNPPVANAGEDRTVIDSNNDGLESIQLNGSLSNDPDGSITAFVWSSSGSQIATGSNPNVDLPVGVHLIQLEVTDNEGATDVDQVLITVEAFSSQPPVANAGPDQTVTDSDATGFESVNLDGSASVDPDGGSLVSYIWTLGSDQIATGVSPNVNLAIGQHDITLTVTDDEGDVHSDSVLVIVEPRQNQAPNANAGSDQTVTDADNSGFEQIVLDASASSDPDGTIVSYSWILNSNVIASGVSPTIELAVGVHDVQLQVTDNEGAIGTDNVLIQVDPFQSSESGLLGEYFNEINLTGLAGTRVDPTIDFQEADFGDGPSGLSGGAFVTPDDNYSERWTGFVRVDQPGNWTFYTTSNDGVRLWVNNQQLIDHWDQHAATEDSQSISLAPGWHPIRLEHFQQNGSVVIELRYSGPGQPKTIIPSTHLATSLPPDSNQPPSANAGADQTLNDSDNSGFESVQLDGTSSSDPDGQIVAYTWTAEDGETLANTASPSLELAVGTHTLQLLVTDNDGASDTDQVVITIEGPTENQPPSADAGPDQTIEGGNSIDVTLTNPGFEAPGTGKIQDGFDGSIDVPGWSNGGASYLDSGVENGGSSGSYRGFLANSDSSVFQLTSHSLIAGEQLALSFAARSTWGNGILQARLYYEENGRQEIVATSFPLTGQFETLSVRASVPEAAVGKRLGIEFDNTSGGTTYIGLDDVRLTATVPGQVILDGSNSFDADGTIASYVWTEGGAVIANGVRPTVQLGVGIHTIQLTVTDDDGATSVDTVVITVSGAGQSRPTANAGEDQLVTDADNNGSESIQLDGSLSSDSDGTIVQYVWSINTATIGSGPRPTVDLAIGRHEIQLTVTDNDGLTDTDQVVIDVLSGNTNQIPLLNPGFEFPARGKIADGFDGQIDVPGWSNDGVQYNNSGVEQGYQLNGEYAAFLRGDDDAVNQLTSHQLAAGEQLKLSFYARNTWQRSMVRATLFYVESGTQQVLTEQDFDLQNSYSADPLVLRSAVPASAIGKTLGLRFENVASGDVFLAIDDVMLELEQSGANFGFNFPGDNGGGGAFQRFDRERNGYDASLLLRNDGEDDATEPSMPSSAMNGASIDSKGQVTSDSLQRPAYDSDGRQTSGENPNGIPLNDRAMPADAYFAELNEEKS
ncbi:MAG: PKD domain-containing protein, partial [Planctomycetota bacterium]